MSLQDFDGIYSGEASVHLTGAGNSESKHRYGGFCRMTTFCKTFIPEEIKKRLEPIQNDDAAVKAYAFFGSIFR